MLSGRAVCMSLAKSVRSENVSRCRCVVVTDVHQLMLIMVAGVPVFGDCSC